MFSLSPDSLFALCLVMAMSVVGFLLVAVAFVKACHLLDETEDAARSCPRARDGGRWLPEGSRKNPASGSRPPVSEHMRIPGRLR